MEISIYHLHDQAVPLAPGRPERTWMNKTHNHFAYRCLPLVMANRSGWEALCPAGLTAEWDGGVHPSAIKITMDEPGGYPFALTHFGYGVLTFHSGYIIKTPEGVSLWTMGPPNEIRDGIQPLAGIIETPWLPFTFTMNWMFTRPGRVRFNKGDAFAFMTPTRLGEIEQAVPVEREIKDDPAVQEAYEAWAASRRDFNARQAAGDPEVVAQGWQRHYMRGRHPEGTPAEAPADHRTTVKVAKVRALPDTAAD